MKASIFKYELYKIKTIEELSVFLKINPAINDEEDELLIQKLKFMISNGEDLTKNIFSLNGDTPKINILELMMYSRKTDLIKYLLELEIFNLNFHKFSVIHLFVVDFLQDTYNYTPHVGEIAKHLFHKTNYFNKSSYQKLCDCLKKLDMMYINFNTTEERLWNCYAIMFRCFEQINKSENSKLYYKLFNLESGFLCYLTTYTI